MAAGALLVLVRLSPVIFLAIAAMIFVLKVEAGVALLLRVAADIG